MRRARPLTVNDGQPSCAELSSQGCGQMPISSISTAEQFLSLPRRGASAVSNNQRAVHDDDSVHLEIIFVDRNDFNVRDFQSLTAAQTRCTPWQSLRTRTVAAITKAGSVGYVYFHSPPSSSLLDEPTLRRTAVARKHKRVDH